MYSQNEFPRINVIDKDSKTDSHCNQNCTQKKSVYYCLIAIFITLIVITVIGFVWNYVRFYSYLESKPDMPKIGCKNSNNCSNLIDNYDTSINETCDCNINGSIPASCVSKRGCICKTNIIGNKCTTCKLGYTGFPNCTNKIIPTTTTLTTSSTSSSMYKKPKFNTVSKVKQHATA